MSRLVLDLSSNNPRPNFLRLRQGGVEGLILKVTEGAGYDPDWDVGDEWAPTARKRGLRIGFYHYARPSGQDAITEARNFAKAIKRAGGCQRRDFRPFLDLEETDIGWEKLYQWSRNFNQEIRNQGLPTPGFYTYPNFLKNMKPKLPLGNGLWFASYTGRPGVIGHSFAPWKKVHLHQYNSIGFVRVGNYVYPPTVGADGRRHLDMNHIMRLTAILAHPIAGLV